MKRRSFIAAALLASSFPFLLNRRSVADHGKIEPLKLSDEEWRKRLTKEQYYILREEGTEYPYSSPLNNEKRDGVYHCAACDLSLFLSSAKYDSGTGWPSFFKSIPRHVATKTDFRLLYPRTEYHCARCGGHQGHVFDDGPRPTGQRWCNNGLALKFVANEPTNSG